MIRKTLNLLIIGGILIGIYTLFIDPQFLIKDIFQEIPLGLTQKTPQKALKKTLSQLSPSQTPQSSSEKSLQNRSINQIWHSDFKALYRDQKLPQAWVMVKGVVFFPTNPSLKKWVPQLRPPIKINPQGEYILEVTLISHKAEAGHAQVIFQHNLIDDKTQDTIWELSRTYNLK